MKHEPLDIEEEIYNLTQVRRDRVSGLYSITFPSFRTLQQVFLALGVRTPPPDHSDPIYKRIQSRVQANWESWKAWADSQSSFGKEVQMTSKPINDNAITAATIKGMATDEVRRRCAELGLQVEAHPTNKGITAMRYKNALTVAMRKQAA